MRSQCLGEVSHLPSGCRVGAGGGQGVRIVGEQHLGREVGAGRPLQVFGLVGVLGLPDSFHEGLGGGDHFSEDGRFPCRQHGAQQIGYIALPVGEPCGHLERPRERTRQGKVIEHDPAQRHLIASGQQRGVGEGDLDLIEPC